MTMKIHAARLAQLRSLAAKGAIFISGCAVAGALGYRINVTPSLPLGIWRTAAIDNAEFVEFCLPDGPAKEVAVARGYLPNGLCSGGGAPLLKPVAARSGDLVEVTAQGVAVNGHLVATPIATVDSAGRAMPAVARGMHKVAPHELWVLSSYHPGSFDSRYYGAIPRSSVLAGMVPVLTFNLPNRP